MVFTERQKGELKTITNDIAHEVVKNAISDEEFLNVLINKISDKVSQKINAAIKTLTTKINKLETKIVSLENENVELKMKTDELEQYSKNNRLRIYGLPENDDQKALDTQVTEMLAEKMGLQGIVPMNSYRIGTKKNNKIRTTIVVFESLKQKNLVYINKKKLKGSKVVITEELTKKRYDLLLLAKEKLGKNSVWTMDGKIYTKINNKKIKIKNEEDIENLEE